MLIENKNFLRIKHRDLLNELKSTPRDTNISVIEKSKNGLPTIKTEIDSQYKYIHSKYDPSAEADRLVDYFECEESRDHIIVFGFGLGYHLQSLMQKHPDFSFTIYEPDLDVFNTMLNTIKLDEIFDRKKLSFITRKNLEQKIHELQTIYNHNIQVFSLPFYERYYNGELHELYKLVVTSLKNQKGRLVTNVSFQQRWTVNAIKNIPAVLRTPNILKDVNTDCFKDQTAIIVAAGPSLNYEYENLKYIKENKQAYIFSVGSAINSLIEHDILPDAACTYDPTEKNQIVFKSIKEKNIKDVPLIFGSTVGYETLENYPGNMLHMITNQDTVTPVLLDKDKDIQIVFDAPSIAVVTFQLLTKLGFSQIILVGQNLAYEKNKMYADGISYAPETITNKMIPTQNVYGEEVFTDEGFSRMKDQLEQYISLVDNIKVYNTTKGGARIKGASFIPLEKLIHQDYLEKNTVESEWDYIKDKTHQNYHSKNILSLYKAKIELQSLIIEANKVIDQCKAISINNTHNLEKKLVKFDKLFKKVKKNKYYITIIGPMIRVQTEQLVNQSKKVRLETDMDKRLSLIDNYFGAYLLEIESHISLVEPHMKELIEDIENNNVENEILYKDY
ncbi:motility associated factor glycosyltransferase family protein [Paraliobacillus salinarum]|uniref:motility associated factor glycosyltransferase family protein n=1 Tax=Paraliobacillus salinarum TaxID=1158996 RepID=UPI0015F621EB|nr:6-hydroxymethylpterin diphosphokinase MptE-like protein [Paraliobacillus salinarum]